MRISLTLLKGTEILVRSFEKFRIARKNPPSGKLTLGLQKKQTLNKNNNNDNSGRMFKLDEPFNYLKEL